MKKMTLFLVFIVLLIASGCSQNAKTNTQSETQDKKQEAASDFPEKPIELIVPTAPGGSNDTVARVLASTVSKYLPNKQTVIVVNEPGGGNTIGMINLMKAQPDGYTLGFVPSFTLTINPHYGNTPYTHDSFQTIMRVLQLPGYIYVKADAPWQSFEEWMEYAKEHPNQVSIGAAVGSKSLADRINKEADVKMKVVPFEGSAPAMTALLGGHVDAAVGSNLDAKSHIEAGTIRPLIGTSGRKTGDVPILKEKGINVEVNQLMGLVAPKGLKEAELKILHDAFKQALEDPEFTSHLAKMGIESYYGGPEEFQKDLSKNFEIDGKALKASGIIQ